MAQRIGKCINFGLCSQADGRETIQVAGGGDFSCPECGKPLTETTDAAGSSGRNAAGGKKAAVIAGLGLLLIAGSAYKFLSPADTSPKKTDTTQNVVIPPDTNPPADPNNRKGVKIPIDQPPAAAEERAVKTPPIRRNNAPGVMVARLLSPINTKTNRDGDTFSAIVENGPYRGQTLTGTIKKLTKNKKNAELQLDFEKLGGKRIPVQLDLVSITNSKGVKGVDDENNIVGKSSKTKVAIVTAAGVVVGAVLGKVFGLSKKETTLTALAGGGGGYLLSMKVMSRAQSIELNPGSLLTLRESTH
jgi:hypothetical protein